MEKSKEALKILITGESNAVKIYEAFSKKAFEDGYKNIALLSYFSNLFDKVF